MGHDNFARSTRSDESSGSVDTKGLKDRDWPLAAFTSDDSSRPRPLAPPLLLLKNQFYIMAVPLLLPATPLGWL